MKHLHIPVLALALACAAVSPAHAQSTVLTPNQIGGVGTLPNGYDQITFNLYDANWAPTVVLPDKPRDNATVLLRTTAQYGTDLDASRTDLGIAKLPLVRNLTYALKFSAASGRWTFSGDAVNNFTTVQNGAAIPTSTRPITYYRMWDANWAPKVTLPTSAADQSIVVVRSDATYGSQVAGTGQLFASTTAIRTGDAYTFVYRKDLNGWALASAPVRRLVARNILAGVPAPTSPRTLVEFWDGNWTDTVRLPAAAGDRDRVTVRSYATWTARIDNARVAFNGTMLLSTGDEYQFMFNAGTGLWELVSSPQTSYQANDLTAAKGVLPAMRRPRTVVQFADYNWVPTLTLPAIRKPGDRVIVRSAAQYGFTVRAETLSAPVTNGEIVSFVADASNTWKKETATIDELLLYSDKASAKMGENVMRARLVEALGMTNDALENSRANFRFRIAGLRQVPAKATWTSLGHPLDQLRSDPVVQGWRNQARADGIYYEGTEDGCGLAWVNADAYSMVASGTVWCGTNVMRHELGHNMGLPHSMGHTLPGTIMNGNALPFFAAPYLFDEQGLPMTPAGGWNEVATMNTRSSAVAAFR